MMTIHPPLPPDANPELVKALAEVDKIVADLGYLPEPIYHPRAIHIESDRLTATEVFRNRRTGKMLASLQRTKKAPQ